ncbi:MAG: class I SAM-dependent methyltransferase [bacterium]
MGRLKWLKKIFPTMRAKIVTDSINSIGGLDFTSVLVVGSGKDPYRKLFRKSLQYICLDIIPEKGITNVIGDALNMPLISSSFDCVFASEVMEHLSDPIIFVKEIFRVLKSDGTVILTVPFLFHQHSDPYDFWRPTYGSLVKIFAAFKEVSVMTQGNRLHVIADLITTSFYPIPVFFPLRFFNHVLFWLFKAGFFLKKPSSAPSGFLLIAKK